jgi:hypothetical protein
MSYPRSFYVKVGVASFMVRAGRHAVRVWLVVGVPPSHELRLTDLLLRSGPNSPPTTKPHPPHSLVG